MQQGVPAARRQRASLHLQSSQSSTSSTSPSPSRVPGLAAVDAVAAALDGSATASEGNVESRVLEPTLHLTWYGSQNSSDDDFEGASATGEEVLLSSQIPV